MKVQAPRAYHLNKLIFSLFKTRNIISFIIWAYENDLAKFNTGKLSKILVCKFLPKQIFLFDFEFMPSRFSNILVQYYLKASIWSF